MSPAPVLPGVMTRWIHGRPAAPLLTFYGADGARVELSAASCANAVSKAVNLLSDELLLEPGAVVWLDLPCHWQAPVLAIAAWAAGLTVSVGSQPPAAAAATIATGQGGQPPRGTPLAVPLHPWGLPLGSSTPPGWEDYAALARIQPDTAALRWPDPDQPWLLAGQALLGGELAAMAGALARSWALPESGRLLTALAPDRATGLLACTVVPALVGGSVVLAGGGDLADISRQERNDATATDV